MLHDSHGKVDRYPDGAPTGSNMRHDSHGKVDRYPDGAPTGSVKHMHMRCFFSGLHDQSHHDNQSFNQSAAITNDIECQSED